MIATLIIFQHAGAEGLAFRLAVGTVLGSALQFAVQVPEVLRLVRKLRPAWDTRSEHVREVIRNFGPVSVSRGVVQIEPPSWTAGARQATYPRARSRR